MDIDKSLLKDTTEGHPDNWKTNPRYMPLKQVKAVFGINDTRMSELRKDPAFLRLVAGKRPHTKYDGKGVFNYLLRQAKTDIMGVDEYGDEMLDKDFELAAVAKENKIAKRRANKIAEGKLFERQVVLNMMSSAMTTAGRVLDGFEGTLNRKFPHVDAKMRKDIAMELNKARNIIAGMQLDDEGNEL